MDYGNYLNIWNIIKEKLADEEISDENLDASYGYKAQQPLIPIDVCWKEEISVSRSETPRMKRYSDVVKTQHVIRLNMPMYNTDNRSQSQTKTSEFYKRPRHTFETCRKRLGLFLINESDNRLMRNIPDRRSQENTD